MLSTSADDTPTRKRTKRDPASLRIVGVDGEGHDLPDGRHVYTYLACVDEHGKTVCHAHNPDGLSHEECARLLLAIPKDCLVFGFMFSYDVTKILEDLPLADVYSLVRPDTRQERFCTECRKVQKDDALICPEPCGSVDLRTRSRPLRMRGRLYDFFNGSIEIKALGKGGHKVKVWDCFRFFGCAFVEAIKDWNVGSEVQVSRIAAMKEKRGALELEDPKDVQAYCREECHLLAVMMRRLIDGHIAADIPLEHFYGAGSTASALLTKHAVAELRGPKIQELPSDLQHAIAAAFFGGRFEDDVVGIVEQETFGFDISSAYPYAQSALPCLRCGTWRYVERATPEMLSKAAACVAAFRVHKVPDGRRRDLAWCPLPFRSKEGSITYGTHFRGWGWAVEILAALAGWPDLVALAGPAWIYETACEHIPFGFVPAGYRTRIEWGKEGAGKSMKLGLNAGYGKTAQAIGDDPPYQCWPWAGMTTATTRAQLLHGIASAEDRWNILAVATDGIYTTEDLPLGPPERDTGTGDLVNHKGVRCPLGGWERKVIPEGVFVAKPGLYWRLHSELKDVRARGVGRREVFRARVELQDGFLKWDRADMKYAVTIESRRFYGAKHSILARTRCVPCSKSWPGLPKKNGCPTCKGPGTELKHALVEDAEDRTAYGRWALRKVDIAFDPYPKRERTGLSRSGSYARLHVRDLGGEDSRPYDVGLGTTTPEGLAQRAAREFQLEQPDWEEGGMLG